MKMFETYGYSLEFNSMITEVRQGEFVLRTKLVPEINVAWLQKQHSAYFKEKQGFVIYFYWLFWSIRFERKHHSDLVGFTKNKS